LKDLDLYIERLINAETIEDAFEVFTAIMAENGYDRVAYSLLTDHHSIGLPAQHGLATSYPEHWMKYYREMNYLHDDAVVLGIMKRSAPFYWEDLKKDPFMPKKSLTIMRQGAEAGVKDGIAIPLFGRPGEIVGLGLARRVSEKSRDHHFIACASYLSHIFHEKYRNLLLKPVIPEITPRQYEVLSLAADGKTDQEIADILYIKFTTVRHHWNQISIKFDVHGRTATIARAVYLGLVIPNQILKTPQN